MFADADLETAIPGVASAIFFNHGQCCCAGSRLYIEHDVYDDVLAGIAGHDCSPGAEYAGRLRATTGHSTQTAAATIGG